MLNYSERDFVQESVAKELEDLEFELEPPTLPKLFDTGLAPAGLDLKGLPMPLALLRLNRALQAVASGVTVDLQCDAPEAASYLVAFSQVTGHLLKLGDASDAYSVQRK